MIQGKEEMSNMALQTDLTHELVDTVIGTQTAALDVESVKVIV